MAETDQAPPPSDKLVAMKLADAVEKYAFTDRVLIRSIVSRPDGGAGLAGQNVRACGWVKAGREQGKETFAFLELNDGSCPANLQVIVDAGVAVLSKLVATGTCVVVDGILKVPPEGTRQKIELRVEKVVSVGEVDPAKYPIPKTKLTLEFLRDHLHLRSRTNTIASLARIRNALAFATHSFFQEHNFLYVHTQIITTSDCEGAGEMFQVTTLISDSEKLEKELIKNPPPSEADIEAARQLVSERGEGVKQLKAAKASKSDIAASVAELNRAKESLSKLEERSTLKPGSPKRMARLTTLKISLLVKLF
ncbi:Asparagine--tRNA ligase [Hibiscus syriacus]|uniref:Asparagine--tRNA ligase n=1 Tax=Hibiscus syriacus TaxID=106335 RepID=A0A6A2Y7E8_HIBSY|nr:Asparagine--tRNA ligase [Hibiscus syriacus]